MRVCFRFTALLVLLAACSRRGEAPAPAASQKSAEVAPPVGLVAELTVPDPRKSWSALRKLGGSRAEILPSSFELALFSLLDLPPRVAGYVRPETPIVGVVFVAPGAPPALVIGMRTIRGSELVGELTKGASAELRAERDGTPVTVLVGSKATPALGVVDDWLLVANGVAALRSAGAYVARGLGVRRMPDAPLTLDVSRGALAGPLSAGVRKRWAELRAELSAQDHDARAARGRAPDFADPAAVLAIADGAVTALVDFIGSTEHLRLTLWPELDRLEVSLSVAPQPNGVLARSIEALEVGPIDPMLELPSSVLFATLSRSSEAERGLAAEKPADALRSVLGPRLAEKDAAPLAEALRSFHRGRGAVAMFGMFSDASLFLKQEAREPKELERGLRGFLRALRVPALADPLEPLVGKVLSPDRETRLAGIEGPVRRVELVRQGAQGLRVEVLVHVRGSSASMVYAPHAGDALLALSRDQKDSLGTLPTVGPLAKGSHPAALAVYADLSAIHRAVGPAPALATLGRKGSDAELDLALSAPACVALLETYGSP